MPLKTTLEHLRGSRTPCTFLYCSIRRIQQCSNVPIQIEDCYTSTTPHYPLQRVRGNDKVGNVRETRRTIYRSTARGRCVGTSTLL
jgi:hypothetical protein